LAPKAKRIDWHPADIMAALRKTTNNKGRGWTMRELSLESGYSENVVSIARTHPWPAVEAIIGRTLGIHPREIWPSRYADDGTPKRRTAHPHQARRHHRVSRASAA
jgi:Ner family transcriptional regulator